MCCHEMPYKYYGILWIVLVETYSHQPFQLLSWFIKDENVEASLPVDHTSADFNAKANE